MENTDASLIFHSASGTELVERQRKRALWFWTEVLEKNFLLQKTNKDIKWTSSEGTLKEYFIHSIFISGFFFKS